MNESSNSGFNTDNSICSKETINTSTSFEKDAPVSENIKDYILKSISKNLKEIINENIQNNQIKYIKNDLFFFSHVPEITLDDYLYRIYKNTKMNISSLIISIIYIDRFIQFNRYILGMNNIHKILLSSCLLSIKFNEDINYDAKYYSKVVGLPVYDLNNLEFYFYVKLQFKLFVDYDIYQKYYEYFSKDNNIETKESESEKETKNNKNDKIRKTKG